MAVTTKIWYCLRYGTFMDQSQSWMLYISSENVTPSIYPYDEWTIATDGVSPPWQYRKSEIKYICVENTISPQYCKDWFSGCSAVERMDISKLDTSNVRNMREMFYGCNKLTSLDVSGFDTSNVTNMQAMFGGCNALTSLDLSGFNTSNVTSMYGMFSGCELLTSLDLSSFNTSNVTSMVYMFNDCKTLTSLDLSGFNTSNVASMSGMFYDCKALASLDLSGFDTSNVTGMNSMFENCHALTSLDLSGFDTSNVTIMSFMFYGCESLTSLDLSDFDTSNVTNMAYMFYGCESLTSLDLSGFDTSNVKSSMVYMFYDCESLTSLDLSGFDTSKVTNMAYMFYSCESLTSLDLSGFDTSKVTNMAYMFYSCESLTSLDLSGFDTSNVTNMSFMFYDCYPLTSLNLSGFNTSNVTSMSNMFYRCYRLTSLDVSGFNTSKVTSMQSMFSNCSALTSLDVSGFDTSNVTNMDSMFYYCVSLTSLDVSGFNTSKVTNMSYMFNRCENFSGDIFINCDPLSYSDMFKGTKKPIYLFGTSNILPQLAATANYDNVILWSLSDTLKADRDDELPSSANLSVTVNRFRGNNETLSDIKVYEEPNTTPLVLTWDDPTFTMDSAVKTFNTTLYNLDETKTHSIRVVVEDTYGTADAKFVSIPTVYYTIDFLAGGKEISFGEKATKDDLYSPVTGSSAPTFASDTYYERSVDGTSITYTLLDEEPDDWENTYTDYYTLTHQNGLFKCAMDTAFNDMTTGSGGEVEEFVNNLDFNGQGVVLEVEHIVPSITVTTGALVSSNMYRLGGKLVMLTLAVNNTAATAAGANLFAGTLNHHRPIMSSTSGSYYGTSAINGAVTNSGGIVVRNASTGAITITGTNNATITFIYIEQ